MGELCTLVQRQLIANMNEFAGTDHNFSAGNVLTRKDQQDNALELWVCDGTKINKLIKYV